jgi:hypothetical protein
MTLLFPWLVILTPIIVQLTPYDVPPTFTEVDPAMVFDHPEFDHPVNEPEVIPSVLLKVGQVTELREEAFNLFSHGGDGPYFRDSLHMICEERVKRAKMEHLPSCIQFEKDLVRAKYYLGGAQND